MTFNSSGKMKNIYCKTQQLYNNFIRKSLCYKVAVNSTLISLFHSFANFINKQQKAKIDCVLMLYFLAFSYDSMFAMPRFEPLTNKNERLHYVLRQNRRFLGKHRLQINSTTTIPFLLGNTLIFIYVVPLFDLFKDLHFN